MNVRRSIRPERNAPVSVVPSSRRRFELLMDHPPLAKRLAALEEIARELGRPVR